MPRTPKISTRTVLDLATGSQRKPRAKRRHLEAQEQRLFVRRWGMDPRTRELPACAVPNGGKRNAREAALMKAEGVEPGVPDWLCFAPGRAAARDHMCVGLAFEFKSPTGKGRMTDMQWWWRHALITRGWRVATVTSAAEAWAIVCDYLALDP